MQVPVKMCPPVTLTSVDYGRRTVFLPTPPFIHIFKLSLALSPLVVSSLSIFFSDIVHLCPSPSSLLMLIYAHLYFDSVYLCHSSLIFSICPLTVFISPLVRLAGNGLQPYCHMSIAPCDPTVLLFIIPSRDSSMLSWSVT